MREPQLVEVPRVHSLARPGYDGSAGVLSVGAGPVLLTLENLRARFMSLRGFSELIFFSSSFLSGLYTKDSKQHLSRSYFPQDFV